MNNLFNAVNAEFICKSADGKGKLVKTTFKNITNIAESKNSELKTPSEQIDIDKDKVAEIYNCYKNNSAFFLSKCVVTVGCLMHDNVNIYYLIDGQHRMKAIKKLFKNDNINDDILISFQNLKSNSDITNLFMELNKDSEKNLYIVQKEMKDAMKLIELKKLMSDKWAGCYAQKKQEIRLFYTLTEFIEMLDKNKFFSKYYKKLDAKNTKNGAHYDDLVTDINNQIIKVIDDYHKKFFSDLDYLENAKTTGKLNPAEIKMINNRKNMMFSKQNNFISYLCMDHDPYHEYKSQRHKFSKSERDELWESHYDGRTEHVCPIFNCGTIMYKNIPYGFHIGHKISLYNKGTNDIDNLAPICASCNSRMNTTDFDDYNENEKLKYIWKKYKTSECQGDKCNKDINRTNFRYIEFKNKKTTTYKLVCKKCHDRHTIESSESDPDSDSECVSDSDS